MSHRRAARIPFGRPTRTGALAIALLACGGPTAVAPPVPAVRYHGGDAPVARAADAAMIEIPAGTYVAGSTATERAMAYADYRATAGHDAARRGGWFDREEERHIGALPTYWLDRTPVTNAAYAEMVADGAAAPPAIDEATWRAQRFEQDFVTEVARAVWIDGRPPPGREDHPVVLITWAEAAAYCAWRGQVVGDIGGVRELPTAAELEKAARGEAGRIYPWGDHFDPARLNNGVTGPGDTVAVGSFPDGAGPSGVLDLAGNVFEWTATPWSHVDGEMTVKGSAWEDFAGLGRGASQHGRPPTIRHVIIGFRCARQILRRRPVIRRDRRRARWRRWPRAGRR